MKLRLLAVNVNKGVEGAARAVGSISIKKEAVSTNFILKI
jgi:hypothetical protein